MTNSIIAIVALVVSTNWTDQIHDGRQLGYQVTNHIATVVYQNETNVFKLKEDVGPFIWAGTKIVIGPNAFGETNKWYYLTNGGFHTQEEYRNEKFVFWCSWK